MDLMLDDDLVELRWVGSCVQFCFQRVGLFGAPFFPQFLDFPFNQVVGTVAFFGDFVVNHRVAEALHVAAGFPDTRVHQDSSVNPFNVVAVGHGAPP